MASSSPPLLSKLRESTRTLLSTASYHAHTLFLFTKADYHTTMLPVSTFALCAAPVSSIFPFSYGVQAVLWLWLHLLAFDIYNQSNDAPEDKINKPDRPLPAGRITLANVHILKVVMITLAMIVSICYSLPVFYASFCLWAASFAYHDLNGTHHWLTKATLNAIGFCSFAAGEMFVAAHDRSRVEYMQILSISTMFGIVLTTIHVQDFRDVIGDAKSGRRTFPIAFPRLSRYVVLTSILFWSAALTYIWELDTWIALPYTLYGLFVGLRFLILRNVESDRNSYIFFNFWFAASFIMPAYWRMYKATPTSPYLTREPPFQFSCCNFIM